MSNPLKKLGKFLDENKFQLAAIATIGLTGGMAMGAFGGLSSLSAGQAVLLGSGLSMSGQMAAGEAAEQSAERDRDRDKRDYDNNTNFFGINRLQSADEANTAFNNSAVPRTAGSREIAGLSAMPTSNPVDDYINNEGAV